MSVTDPAGFVAAGMHCGIRRKRPDLCIVRSLEPAVGGGMFTRNRVKAAAVLVNQDHLAQAEPQAGPGSIGRPAVPFRGRFRVR